MARASIVAGIVAVVIGCVVIATAQSTSPQEPFRFTYRPLEVGDEAQEATHFVLDLKTVRLHDGQVIDIADQVIERDEDSHVVRLPPGPGQSAKAKVTYQASRQTARGRRGVAAAESDRPVAGKTYLVARQGEDLLIVDEQGAAPPDDEQAIVSRAMDGLGRTSPLGTFLNGRTVKVGETLRLPAEFTQKMLAGWDESIAALPLDVIFMGTQHVDGQRCALLHTPPAAAAKPGAERAPVEGKLLIEFDTCRLAVMELRGSVSAIERQGQPGEEFDVRRKGKLQVAVHVEHHRAAR
jgi:hypothetical protein